MQTTEHSDKIIRAILDKIVSDYAPEKVILFGSRAYGQPGPDSDVDLLIIKDTTQRFLDRWTSVLGILTGTHPGVAVEPLVMTPGEIEERLAAGDQFIREILEKGEVLYAGQ
jgi:predicted nucleotidyltransferase